MPALRRHGLVEDRLLDVGCGTGKSFIPMLARGWEVTACDISPSMAQRARAKVGDAVDLRIADMRKLAVVGEFDLVWCLADAVNYLLSAQELQDALCGMRANLAPHGLLLFDVNTLHSYNTFFSQTEVVEANGLRITWRGRASGKVVTGSECEAHFEVQDCAEGNAQVHVPPHIHRQRHYPEAEIFDQLLAAGLECLDVFGHGYDAALEQPVDEEAHTKMVYIARRL